MDIPLEPDTSTPDGQYAVGGSLLSAEVFAARKATTYEALKNDPEKQLVAIAEIHTALFMLLEGMGTMMHQMQSAGGPAGLLKMVFGRNRG